LYRKTRKHGLPFKASVKLRWHSVYAMQHEIEMKNTGTRISTGHTDKDPQACSKDGKEDVKCRCRCLPQMGNTIWLPALAN
jgi:hypothetical protein